MCMTLTSTAQTASPHPAQVQMEAPMELAVEPAPDAGTMTAEPVVAQLITPTDSAMAESATMKQAAARTFGAPFVAPAEPAIQIPDGSSVKEAMQKCSQAHRKEAQHAKAKGLGERPVATPVPTTEAPFGGRMTPKQAARIKAKKAARIKAKKAPVSATPSLSL